MDFAAFLFFAVLIERLIEYFVKPRIDGKYIIYVALGLGLVVSFGYQLDLIAAMGIAKAGFIGYALSGLVLAGGSNFLNDVIGAVRSQKTEAAS